MRRLHAIIRPMRTRMFERPAGRIATVVLAVALALAGCAEPDGPTPTPSPSANPGNGPMPPVGDAVRFDEVTLSEDGWMLTLTFVGGREYNPRDPCSSHYFGWAHERDGFLEAKIVDDTPPFPNADPNIGCDAMGHGRVVTIDLDSPYRGFRVDDLAGSVHFLRRPDGLAEFATPPGWVLVRESDVQESPTGRWLREWTRGEEPRNGPSIGKIALYQSFGGPAGVSGGEEVSSVRVNGADAVLYRAALDVELVLVGMVGKDGMALVVNEADFPMERAIELAESVIAP